jgi:hypothetical protein
VTKFSGVVRLELLTCSKPTLWRIALSSEVEDPTSDKAAKDRETSQDDGDIVFDMADAVVDVVSPIGRDLPVDAVAILQIYLG